MPHPHATYECMVRQNFACLLPLNLHILSHPPREAIHAPPMLVAQCRLATVRIGSLFLPGVPPKPLTQQAGRPAKLPGIALAATGVVCPNCQLQFGTCCEPPDPDKRKTRKRHQLGTYRLDDVFANSLRCEPESSLSKIHLKTSAFALLSGRIPLSSYVWCWKAHSLLPQGRAELFGVLEHTNNCPPQCSEGAHAQ